MTEAVRAGGVRRDATVLTVGTMASGIAAYGFVAVGTRSVGAEAFAPVSVLWSLWAVSAAAITFPVQHWIIRTVEAARDETGVWAATPALWRTVGVASLLVFATTGMLGERLFTTPGWAFPLMAACLPAGSVVMGFNRGFLAARDRFRATAVAILGENLLRVLLALVLAAAVTAQGLGWILVAGFAVGLLYPGTLFGRSNGASAPPTRSLLGGLAGANAAAQVALTSGPIVLSLVGGTEAAVTALFAMLAVLRAPHTVAVGMTARVTGPLTRLATTGQVARLRSIEFRLAAATAVLAALGALVAPAVVPPVTVLVFDVGEDVPAVATAMLTAGTVVALAGLVEMLVLVALNRTRRLVGAWAGAIVAGGATLLVPATPITRVAAAFLVAEAVALALMAGRPRSRPRGDTVPPHRSETRVMHLEPAPLETSRFGIEVVRCTGRGAEFAQVRDAAQELGADLVIARCDVEDVAGTHALEAAGARLMDTHLSYACSTDGSHPDDDPRIRRASQEDLDTVEELARTAFTGYVGHFHTDDRLAPGATDVYVDWAGRMLLDTSGSHVMWLAEDQQGPLGFATLRLEGDEAVAVLDAVASRARGTGLHAALVRSRMAEAHRRGVRQVIFRTHLANVGARRSFIRLGFLPTVQEHTFHLWMDGQESRPAP